MLVLSRRIGECILVGESNGSPLDFRGCKFVGCMQVVDMGNKSSGAPFADLECVSLVSGSGFAARVIRVTAATDMGRPVELVLPTPMGDCCFSVGLDRIGYGKLLVDRKKCVPAVKLTLASRELLANGTLRWVFVRPELLGRPVKST